MKKSLFLFKHLRDVVAGHHKNFEISRKCWPLNIILLLAAMERRKEELEKKRQKLAELRRAREERRAVLESQTAQQQPGSSVSQPPFQEPLFAHQCFK
jgi:hypothetical protein